MSRQSVSGAHPVASVPWAQDGSMLEDELARDVDWLLAWTT